MQIVAYGPQDGYITRSFININTLNININTSNINIDSIVKYYFQNNDIIYDIKVKILEYKLLMLITNNINLNYSTYITNFNINLIIDNKLTNAEIDKFKLYLKQLITKLNNNNNIIKSKKNIKQKITFKYVNKKLKHEFILFDNNYI